MRVFAVAGVLGLVVACGAGGDPESHETRCNVPAAYGAQGELSGAVAALANQPGSMGTLKRHRLWALLGSEDPAEPPIDQVYLDLWDTFGAFDGGPATTGTYELTGPALDLETCGVCLQVYGDFDPLDGPARTFLAQGGTVEITSLEGSFAGSLSEVTLAEMDPESGELISGGCTVEIEAASFAAPLESGGGGGGGDGSGSGDGTGGGDGSG